MLLVSVCALQAGCMYGKQDDSEEGRAAIRLVMNYKVPLGYLIHNCIEDYLYDREKKELRIERVGWVAYRRPYLQAGHRVSYRFNERGRELEARWIADIKTGKVEPENELARTIMKLN